MSQEVCYGGMPRIKVMPFVLACKTFLITTVLKANIQQYQTF